MSTTPGIRQGESLPFAFDLNGQSIVGWVCTIFVKEFPSSVAQIARIIEPTGRAWVGYLTSTETKGLDESVKTPWYLIAILENASTGQQIEFDKRFSVSLSANRLLLPSFILVTGTPDGILLTGTSDKLLITA